MPFTIPEQLFTIETNQGFDWAPVSSLDSFKEVLSAFQIPQPDAVWMMQKPRKVSKVYKVLSGENKWILRSSHKQNAPALEVQCQIAKQCSHLINPCFSSANQHTFINQELVWIAYPKQPGRLFSGRLFDVAVIVEEVVRLENELENIGNKLSEAELQNLPKIEHQMDRWQKDLESYLFSGRFGLQDHLSPFTLNLLKNNRDLILQTAGSLGKQQCQNSLGLVYNDIHHANIIVQIGNQPIFVDIEDIVLESKSIALCYGIFKLLRHVIFGKVNSIEQIRQEKIPRIIQSLEKICPEIADSQRLNHFALTRIISDVWLILNTAFSENNPIYLYDLEKKLHHIFESRQIFLGES